MPLEYGLGGTERPIDASEAISELQQNRTLMIEKLTFDDPVRPQVVEGLTSVEAVFEHYKPTCEVEFENEEGAQINETLSFSNLGDFGVKGITNQSDFLDGLNVQQLELLKVVKQLRSNKVLLKALQGAESKMALMSALQQLIDEIENV